MLTPLQQVSQSCMEPHLHKEHLQQYFGTLHMIAEGTCCSSFIHPISLQAVVLQPPPPPGPPQEGLYNTLLFIHHPALVWSPLQGGKYSNAGALADTSLFSRKQGQPHTSLSTTPHKKNPKKYKSMVGETGVTLMMQLNIG